MAHHKVLTAVGKAAQMIMAEECSNGNGSELSELVKVGMGFEIADMIFGKQRLKKSEIAQMEGATTLSIEIKGGLT